MLPRVSVGYQSKSEIKASLHSGRSGPWVCSPCSVEPKLLRSVLGAAVEAASGWHPRLLPRFTCFMHQVATKDFVWMANSQLEYMKKIVALASLYRLGNRGAETPPPTAQGPTVPQKVSGRAQARTQVQSPRLQSLLNQLQKEGSQPHGVGMGSSFPFPRQLPLCPLDSSYPYLEGPWGWESWAESRQGEPRVSVALFSSPEAFLGQR